MPVPRLLLVTATFAPSRVIGGRRAERLAGHLASAGWDVTVLTLHGRYMGPVDLELRPPIGVKVLRTHATMPRVWLRSAYASLQAIGSRPSVGTAPLAPTRAAAPKATRSGLRKAFERILAAWEDPDEFAGWRPFALRATAGMRFDVVLTSVPPMSTLALAAAIADQTRAHLVLDYRDPWLHAAAADRRTASLANEAATLRRADLVVGVTPAICADLATRVQAPLELITNGFEGAPFEAFSAHDRAPARLVYAGSLAYGRDLEPLLRAMAALRPQVNAGVLQLHYAGQHGAGLMDQAARHGVDDAVVVHGELSSARANALLHGALAGVVLVSPGFAYAYPGKIFEILGQARPMLALAPQGCATAQLLADHGLGWTHPPDDIAGMALSLRAALEGGLPTPRNVDQLHVSAVMGRYEAILRRLLTAPRP